MDNPSESINPSAPQGSSLSKQDKTRIAVIVAAIILILAGIVVAIIFLFKADAAVTGQIRDIFIILMAFESLIIGAALVILVIQLAVLTNLIQHEVKPILDATNQTVNTLKGTTTFLSNNLVEPVIKLNEYMAGFKKILDLLKLGKK